MKIGNTRLFQQTRSPLIQGMPRRRRPVWPWVVGAAAAAAAAGAWVYLAYLR
jgi:hypothetical protein